MLVLSRRLGEEVVVNGTIRVTILAVHGDRVRIGIAAPPSVPVDRQEVRHRRAERAGQQPPSDLTRPAGQDEVALPGVSPHPERR
jgi:carbon storage regulator